MCELAKLNIKILREINLNPNSSESVKNKILIK